MCRQVIAAQHAGSQKNSLLALLVGGLVGVLEGGGEDRGGGPWAMVSLLAYRPACLLARLFVPLTCEVPQFSGNTNIMQHSVVVHYMLLVAMGRLNLTINRSLLYNMQDHSTSIAS